MCTLIVLWNTEGMLVGANRDEKYNRYSEDFAFRPDGVCCPLDVRGGTWIGINDRFVFAALTNLEVPRGDKMGRRSRGDLIFQALKQSNALTAAGKVLELLGSGSYNPCNIFIADNTRLLGITVTEPKIQVAQLSPNDYGQKIHTATPWGIDTWHAPRCQKIKETHIEEIEPLKRLLKYHGDISNSKEESLCLHRKDYGTVSSCVIDVVWNLGFTVFHTDKPPCESYNPWNRLALKAT